MRFFALPQTASAFMGLVTQILIQVQILSFFSWFGLAHAALSAAELFSIQSEGNVIHVTDDNFETLLNGPRDYYVSLLFTTLGPQIHCEQCKKFEPNYRRVSSSYYTSNPGKNGIFFFSADFQNCQKHYNQLQMTHVPKLWVFPPSIDPNYNITSPHFSYEIGDAAVTDVLDFATFISKLLGTHIMVNSEFDAQQFFSYSGFSFFGVLFLKKKVISKMKKSSLFKFASVLAIAVLTSGYMFTLIRGIPLIAKNEKNEIMFYSGGQHWQFGLETFIIAFFYLFMTGLMAALVLYIPKVSDERRRAVLVVSASVLLFCTYDYLTVIFQAKDPSYPFRLGEYLSIR